MLRTIAAATLLTLAATLAPAQNQDLPPVVEPDPAIVGADVHPGQRLGQRAGFLQAQRPVFRTLFIVPDASTALEVIAAWSPGAYWPVLIDDGSAEAAMDIARFVRAFEPGAVRVLTPAEVRAEPVPITRERIDVALGRAWTAPAGWSPPGVVVTDADHNSAVAALALAAGRGQPIVWVDTERRSSTSILPARERDALLAQIETGMAALPYEWASLGDTIDAVAICLDTEQRVRAEGDESDRTLALTDRVGRHASGRRWAYASGFIGTPAATLADAMSALFITHPAGVWAFDGYTDQMPGPYKLARAHELLQQIGLPSRLIQGPQHEREDWRAATNAPIDAGLILVNTQGEAGQFRVGKELKNCYGPDVPTLARPAIVHFIHSNSAKRLGNDWTIGARWLDEGAYAYLGSVDEPRLGAFLSNRDFTARMLAGFSFAAAVRHDTLGPWRLAAMGDPLTIFSNAQPPEPASTPGKVAELGMPLPELLAQAASDADLARMLRLLLLGGDLARGAQLIRAAIEAPPGTEGAPAVTPEAAELGLIFAEHARDPELAVQAGIRMHAETLAGTGHRSRLWRTCRPALVDGSADAALISLLRANARAGTAGDDARSLLPAYERLFGRAGADDMLEDLLGQATNESNKRVIQELLRR